ncbi:MgtC/SapB family protein [Candidatus Gracilibacteria bacterium 28_42_T64]|nr:MgtC/SapB family protein [Candidatus Gracilibacteria bacterium 28_42_T64]
MTTGVIILRLFISALLSMAIGLEREFKHQPAGVRTHILIGIGSCLFMMISILMTEHYATAVSDPSRIAAQVVSGVGFLGAGAILKMGFNTKGLTTAANIWATSAIGLAVGAGFYAAAFAAVAFILFNLVFVSKIKGKFMKKSRYCSIHLEFLKKDLSEKKLIGKLDKLPVEVLTKNIKEDSKKTNIRIIAKINKNIDIYEVHAELKDIEGLSKISIGENVK